MGGLVSTAFENMRNGACMFINFIFVFKNKFKKNRTNYNYRFNASCYISEVA